MYYISLYLYIIFEVYSLRNNQFIDLSKQYSIKNH